jgi:hypothetical protein
MRRLQQPRMVVLTRQTPVKNRLRVSNQASFGDLVFTTSERVIQRRNRSDLNYSEPYRLLTIKQVEGREHSSAFWYGLDRELLRPSDPHWDRSSAEPSSLAAAPICPPSSDVAFQLSRFDLKGSLTKFLCFKANLIEHTICIGI